MSVSMSMDLAEALLGPDPAGWTSTSEAEFSYIGVFDDAAGVAATITSEDIARIGGERLRALVSSLYDGGFAVQDWTDEKVVLRVPSTHYIEDEVVRVQSWIRATGVDDIAIEGRVRPEHSPIIEVRIER